MCTPSYRCWHHTWEKLSSSPNNYTTYNLRFKVCLTLNPTALSPGSTEQPASSTGRSQQIPGTQGHHCLALLSLACLRDRQLVGTDWMKQLLQKKLKHRAAWILASDKAAGFLVYMVSIPGWIMRTELITQGNNRLLILLKPSPQTIVQ